MKRSSIFILLLFALLGGCILGMVSGCQTETAWYDGQQILTANEYKNLPVDQQADFAEVQVKTIKPAVVAQVEGSLETASSTLQIVKPLIPEPFATGSIAILGGLAALWQLISKRKTITVLDRVKLGAQITAESVDTIIKPSIEVWEKFKARQKSESSNTSAIMPDQLKAA